MVAVDDEAKTKLAMKVLSDRVTIRMDPVDPDMPIIPFESTGSPIRRTTWIEKGILRELAYDSWYALVHLNRARPKVNPPAFRVDGGTTSIPEMIQSVKRGLLVTRLVNVRLVHDASLLCTGQTADGLWLIENGKITKSVKNFRFRESPIFMFNNLIAMGPPTRVLMKDGPVIVPPLLVQDFSMNSLNDAV
jgi:predicted Zn-dependent protease